MKADFTKNKRHDEHKD